MVRREVCRVSDKPIMPSGQACFPSRTAGRVSHCGARPGAPTSSSATSGFVSTTCIGYLGHPFEQERQESSRRSCSMQSTHQTGGDIVLACLFPSWFLEQIYKVASTVSSVYTGELGKGPGNGGQKEQGATAGPASGAGALASSGSCDQKSGPGSAQPAPADSEIALNFCLHS